VSRQHVRRLIDLLGLKPGRIGHGEGIVSTLGGFIGIAGVGVVSHYFLGGTSAVLVIASMGSSAVLLFAVPHGPLSQPWPLAGGHLVSATVGVACAMWVPDDVLAGALAVGLAIGGMHYLKCIHPPGGATALTAVVGGNAVHALGWQFVLTPVLANTLVILAVAVLFNYPFLRRRYPAALAQRVKQAGTEPVHARRPDLDRCELERALKELDLHALVPDTELEKIHLLANHQVRTDEQPAPAIRRGACYSNGAFGEQWSVRQVQTLHPSGPGRQGRVEYRVVAGKDRRSRGESTLEEFQRWARHEVIRNENTWQRVEDQALSVLHDKAS
jgi:CBS domain-containing membrane protein